MVGEHMRPEERRIPDMGKAKVLFLVALFGLGGQSAFSQNTVSIEGEVRTEKEQLISSPVMVRLESNERMLFAQAPVSSDGQFRFDSIPKAIYHLITTAEGFQPSERELDLLHSPSRLFLNVYLAPTIKTKPVPEAAPALTDMNAPGKARREYERGSRALREKNLPEALAHFQKAVAEYPCYARAQTDLALALSALHDLPQAETGLKKAIECDPGLLDAYIQLGQLFNLEKRFAEGKAVLEQGVRRSAGSWQFYYQLGIAHYGLKDYTKAESDFLKVRSLNPAPPPELHVKLADAYLKQRAYDKAYPELQDYLRAEPQGRFADKIRSVIQRMESAGVLGAAKVQTNQPPPPQP